MTDPSQTTLPAIDDVRTSAIVVNERCRIYTRYGMVDVFVDGTPMYRYAVEDRSGRAVFLAQAQVTGVATGTALAKALGVSLSTVRRARKRFEDGGVANVVHKKRGPKGARLGSQREQAIIRWHKEGLSAREMARRLGVHNRTVGRAMMRLGLEPARRRKPPVLPLNTGGADPEQSAVSSAINTESHEEDGDEDEVVVGTTAEKSVVSDQGRPANSLDTHPSDRGMDRLLARQGLLDDAMPWFSAGADVANAGVLLAVPFLVHSGIFTVAQRPRS